MTKQEEINESIAIMLHRMQTNPFREPAWLELPEWRKDQYRKNAYFMMVMLDDRGVVINAKSKGLAYALKNSLDLVAVEPLIGGVDTKIGGDKLDTLYENMI